MRNPGPVVRWAFIGATILAILLSASYSFFPYYTVALVQIDLGYYAFLYAFLMPFVFLYHPATIWSRKKGIPWYDILFAILSSSGFAWIGLNCVEARAMGWTYVPPVYVSLICLTLWGLSIEAGRRSGGMAFAIVVMAFSLLPYYGFLLPAPFTSHLHPLLRVPANYLLDVTGVFGPATSALFKFVFAYLIFGCTLQFVGGGEYLIKVALILVGRIRGATAKVSIVSSCIFGMFSGSAVANVVTTGTVTIPAMKKSGYPPYYAGAVEAVASTGGYIMPPVMGAVAFVMAEITAIPYPEIALAAFIPALLYYLAIFIQSDLQAVKLGIRPVPKEERVIFTRRTLLEGWVFLVPMVVLVYWIFVLQLTAEAPFFAMIPLIVGGILNKKITSKTALNLVTQIGDLLVSMMGLFACLGLVTGAVLFTGFGMAISSVMLDVGTGNLLLMLVLGGATAIVLGMGITVTAVYILVALLLVPALKQMGLDPMACHLFVIYYAGVAAFTPPVGTAAATAARMAGAPYMKTGFQAMRLGIVMFIVPLYFVHQPALVLRGTALEVITCFAIILFAMVMMSAGFERHMYGIGRITWPEAIIAVLAGLLIILPIPETLTFSGWLLAGLLVTYWIVKVILHKMRGNPAVTRRAS